MEVENNFSKSNQCLNISLRGAILIFFYHGIEHLHFSITNNSDILPREQSYGDPTMHELQSGMLNVHIARLKFTNYVLTRNFSPKLMTIKTSKSMI